MASKIPRPIRELPVASDVASPYRSVLLTINFIIYYIGNNAGRGDPESALSISLIKKVKVVGLGRRSTPFFNRYPLVGCSGGIYIDHIFFPLHSRQLLVE